MCLALRGYACPEPCPLWPCYCVGFASVHLCPLMSMCGCCCPPVSMALNVWASMPLYYSGAVVPALHMGPLFCRSAWLSSSPVLCWVALFLGIFFPLEKIQKFTHLPYMGVPFFEALFPVRFPGCKSPGENPGPPYGVEGVRGISAFENRGGFIPALFLGIRFPAGKFRKITGGKIPGAFPKI